MLEKMIVAKINEGDGAKVVLSGTPVDIMVMAAKILQTVKKYFDQDGVDGDAVVTGLIEIALDEEAKNER